MRPIEDIISEKAYSELSELELMEVSELASNEEEYNQMKRFFESFTEEVHAEYRFEAPASVKSSLDTIYAAKYPVIAQDWKKEEAAAVNAPVIPLYKRRSLQIAAVLLLCLGSAPLFFRQENETLSSDRKQSGPVASVGTKNKEIVNQDSDGISQTASIPKNTSPILTASVDNPSVKDIDLNELRGDAGATFEFAAPVASAGETHKTIIDGMAADLDPSLFTANSNTGGKTDFRGTTLEASGSDMLDWIQAAY